MQDQVSEATHDEQPEKRQVVRRGIVLLGYWVDRNGDVWSQFQRVKSSGGRIKFVIGVEYNQFKRRTNDNSYQIVCFCHNGKLINVKVHLLVCEAFHGPCPEGMQACHNNGIRSDNRPENLRWDTVKNNEADKVQHGTHNRGERHGMAKLTEQDVIEARALRAGGGWTYKELATRYGVNHSTVHGAVNGNGWKHLLDNLVTLECSKDNDGGS